MALYPSGVKKNDSSRSLNLDSFLFPLVRDLQQLACEDVPSKRRLANESVVNFTLCAQLLLVIGDMPAKCNVRHNAHWRGPLRRR
jgi:hypothetical protein